MSEEKPVVGVEPQKGYLPTTLTLTPAMVFTWTCIFLVAWLFAIVATLHFIADYNYVPFAGLIITDLVLTFVIGALLKIIQELRKK